MALVQLRQYNQYNATRVHDPFNAKHDLAWANYDGVKPHIRTGNNDDTEEGYICERRQCERTHQD